MKLYRFAFFTALTTYVLLLVGGLVHGTGSSLACPDWPLCHGTWMPKMEKGVEYEHTHRLVAALVGVLTLVLGTMVVLIPRYRSFRALGVAAPIMVLIQAILGGITVLYRLPKPITLSHLTLSMAFFSVIIVIAIRMWQADRLEAARRVGVSEMDLATRGASAGVQRSIADPPAGYSPGVEALADLRSRVGLTALAVLAQIALGGLVRHSMAGLACITFPLCFGNAWPPDSYSEQVHMLHRFGAVVVAALVVTFSISAYRRARGSQALRGVRALAIAAPVLIVVQITLGVLSVTSLLHLPTVTAHLGVGALLLGVMVAMWTLVPSRALIGASATRRSADLPDVTQEEVA